MSAFALPLSLLALTGCAGLEPAPPTLDFHRAAPPAIDSIIFQNLTDGPIETGTASSNNGRITINRGCDRQRLNTLGTCTIQVTKVAEGGAVTISVPYSGFNTAHAQVIN